MREDKSFSCSWFPKQMLADRTHLTVSWESAINDEHLFRENNANMTGKFGLLCTE